MHDLDRTFMEFEEEAEGESEAFEFAGESEWGEVLGETEVQELAAELMSVSNEQELNYFLGGLMKRAAKAVGAAMKSPVGQVLGSALRTAAKTALPMAGAALGNMVAPGVGGAIGGKLASAAGSMFGLELEGLSHEDREFEVAKQFVRLAADATNAASRAAERGQPPQQAVRSAMTQAAQKYAPGLLQTTNRSSPSSRQPTASGSRHGRWVRRGNQIVLLGV